MINVLGIGASSICQLAKAVRRDTDDLLRGVGDKNVVEEVKRILEVVLARMLPKG